MKDSTMFFTYEINEEWKKLEQLHRYAIDEIHTKLKILSDEFKHFHKQSPIEHIKTRVKTRKSIITKLEKRGIEPTPENARLHLNDIAGIRVICSFTSDIYHILEILQKQDDVRVITVKDYIENPKENGYQSLHMIVAIPVFLSEGPEIMKVEVQIRTIAMDFWASLEHKLRYKHYENAPTHIAKELKECADLINDLDSRMLRIKYELDNYKEDDELWDVEAYMEKIKAQKANMYKKKTK